MLNFNNPRTTVTHDLLKNPRIVIFSWQPINTGLPAVVAAAATTANIETGLRY